MPVDKRNDCFRFALPKGRLLPATAGLISKAELGLDGYSSKTRDYRLSSAKIPSLSARIFQEKDIPVQVAMGNYDLGICGLDWIEEFLVKYPCSDLIKVANLNYGEGGIYAISLDDVCGEIANSLAGRGNWRIVSEYPNLAMSFALDSRLRSFRIFPVRGVADTYLPENADMAVLWAESEREIEKWGMVAQKMILSAGSFLIANRESLRTKDLSPVLSRLSSSISIAPRAAVQTEQEGECSPVVSTTRAIPDITATSLALPDGHQQKPAVQFLEKAGIAPQEYALSPLRQRPSIGLAGVAVKVIRPQDMPLQVANGNFDLAITGKDWLLDHKSRFPASPVINMLDLGFGMVRVVAAVNGDMPVSGIDELRLLVQQGKLTPLRVASEYVNIADRYLQDNRLCPYKLIPTCGSSEAFLPEDADLLIDNVQTGKTLAKHNLKVIAVLFESAACVIGNKDTASRPGKKEKIASIIQVLQKGLL